MLAAKAGSSNPRNLDYPLGCIGDRLDALADDWDDKIPHTQFLMLNKVTGLPGDGFDGFLRRQGYDWEKGEKAERRAVIQEYWTKVYEYPYWTDVFEELDMEPNPVTPAEVIKAAQRFGGGEGGEHRALKPFCAIIRIWSVCGPEVHLENRKGAHRQAPASMSFSRTRDIFTWSR